MSRKLLSTRLSIAVGNQTARQVAEQVDMNPETVRRYLAGRSPSFEFLAAICEHYEVLGTWLLRGEGPRTREELVKQTLKEVKSNEMLELIASRLDQLEQRIIGIEQRQSRKVPSTPHHTGNASRLTEAPNRSR
ncbi:MAG: helix-turn-helix domain-containing protein [Phycisphaerales bacterium]